MKGLEWKKDGNCRGRWENWMENGWKNLTMKRRIEKNCANEPQSWLSNITIENTLSFFMLTLWFPFDKISLRFSSRGMRKIFSGLFWVFKLANFLPTIFPFKLTVSSNDVYFWHHIVFDYQIFIVNNRDKIVAQWLVVK